MAVNVAAFADGEIRLLQYMCATQLNTIIDEFNRILVGGDISILPLLMRAQIKAGLIGGEVPSATSSRALHNVDPPSQVYVAGFSLEDISSAAVWFGPGQELLSRSF